MQNIVLDCERMKYANTGLYHYCLNLGQHIQKNLDGETEHLSIFGPDATRDSFDEHSAHISYSPLHKFLMPNLKDFHVWHCTYQNSNYVPQRNRKVKVVLSIHDLNFLYENKSEAKKAKHLRHLQANIDRSDAIICISDFCRNDVLEHCNVGNKPIHVIYNGTNDLSSPKLQEESYKPERPFVFSLGVICRKKNFHVLLPLIKNQNLELVIAGRHDDREYLEFIHDSARKMKVDENLRMVGNINEHEKSWYLRNCYAFAFPSIAEGFGLPVTEAMSVGKPIFLSDKTALPEIGSNVAFYFKDFSEKHMCSVFENGMEQYEKRQMHSAIRQRSEAFCWDKAAHQYINVYRSLY